MSRGASPARSARACVLRRHVCAAKDSLEIARKNTASDETVTGLGEATYWDKILRKLSLASGRYMVTVGVEDDNLNVAEAAATRALAKLPK